MLTRATGEEQKAVDEATEGARRHFEKLVNSIDGIVWEADPQTFRFTFVSEQAGRILGYAPEEWLADGFWESHLHPDDRALAIEHCVSWTTHAANRCFEYRMLASDGRVVWLKDLISVEMHDGLPVRLQGIMVDISERRRAEDALRLSAKVFENSTQGISITDPSGRILKVNRAFCSITGYAEDEVVGKTHSLLRSGRQDQQFYRTMWKTLAEEGSWSGEMWNRRKCGEQYVEQLTITRVPDSAGVTANFIGIFSDVSQAKAAQNEIERLSMYDAMTGLPNRAFLYDRLDHALKLAERDGSHVALVAIDLDRLAHINEVLGHHIGDRLLVAAAERLNSVMRGTDTATRHIGDEFVVIMEDLSNPQDAAILSERVLGELSRPFVIEGHEINISACIGIGIYPEDGTSTKVLIKHADVALHHAKESGESNYQFFREEMNQASVERLLIESSLRLALQRNEFHLVYQPQIDLKTGIITGMEVLLRWQHPQMGMVSPARFIPVAEETGHIIEIGLWVLREACRQTQRWHEQGFAGLQVAVNVSARQFRQDDFADQVRQVLEETGLAPECLELELTESLIMQRPERVVGVMGELRALGVKFSIDDFGTGYSSLSQLKRFPIDKLKIDQSFTRDIGTDANGTAITCAIIALGNSLRLRVVAEGVETHDQQRFLVDNGCHSMQGYLFSRPVAANDFHGLLLLQRLQAAV